MGREWKVKLSDHKNTYLVVFGLGKVIHKMAGILVILM